MLNAQLPEKQTKINIVDSDLLYCLNNSKKVLKIL